jgi:S-layer protein (TIGR01567 family)
LYKFLKLIIGGALFCLIVLCGIADAASSNSTGNRIWDGDLNLSLEYSWSPQTFSGFYYDINTDAGSEKLTICLDKNSKRVIGIRDLVYETTPTESDFKYAGWGKYHVIGFMADRYFAGYPDASFSNNLSLMSYEKLSKILIDSNERKSLYSGSSLVLKEGTSLK